ncbi:MAG TPA: hypothetical protein VLK22_04545 [Candidatus Udaeobacter sp.]|nr:hypothetical protein [Candidatus Udaeobacter sp.]
MRIIVSIVIIVACFGFASAVQADVKSNGQLLVVHGEHFGDDNFGGYLHLAGMASTGGNLSMPIYIGGEYRAKGVNFKLLTGLSLSGNGGTSVIASTWFYDELSSDISLFVQGDVYLPTKPAGNHVSLYTYASLSKVRAGSDSGFGLIYENFFFGRDWVKAAVGPTVILSNKNSLWVAYDFQPDGYNLLVRWVVKL